MLTLDDAFLASLDAAGLEKALELTDKYASAAEEIGVFAEHPYKAYNGLNYSIELRDSFAKDCRDTVALAAAAANGLSLL